MPYIYKITNNINQKVYIGKTSSSITHRWQRHKEDAQKDSERHRPLYKAMNKYGIEYFTIELIEEVQDDTVACEQEIYWIEYFQSFKYGYNATTGGDGRAYADYDLIFALFQEGKTGKEISQITGYTDKTITMALKQKGITDKERMLRGKANSKVVFMRDKETNAILNAFPSLSEAERFLQKPRSAQHISEVCKGKRNTAYGYKWTFAT